MLRRHSTRSRKGLSRSKSTSSVRSTPVDLQHINPESARRDARIAATLSFHHAHQWGGDHMAADPVACALSRHASVKTFKRLGEPGLQRQQSIRFVQHAPTRQDAVTAETTRLHDPGQSHPRPVQRSSSLSKTWSMNTVTRQYLDTLLMPEEYCTPYDDIASAPSSYRRIRKSRSMFVSPQIPPDTRVSYPPPQSHSNADKPIILPRDQETWRPTTQAVPAPSLRGPRSMSFLRGRRDQGSRSRSGSGEHQSASSFHQPGLYGLAEEAEQQKLDAGYGSKPLSSYPSLILRARTRQNVPLTGMRKTLRITSNSSIQFPSAASTFSLTGSKRGLLKDKARQVSRSLKNKLKSIFLSTKAEASVVPGIAAATSQIQDSDCVEEDDPFEAVDVSALAVPPRLSECSLSRVPSRVPDVREIQDYQNPRSRRGSVESTGSELGTSTRDGTRILSWSTSGATSQAGWSEHERQRLLVMRENRAHVSSLPRFEALPEEPSADGLDPDSSDMDQLQKSSPVIDSQKVYAALIKRLDETRGRGRTVEMDGTTSMKNSKAMGIFPTRSSSIVRRTSTPHTIRCVGPEDDVFGEPRSDGGRSSQPRKSSGQSSGQLSMMSSIGSQSNGIDTVCQVESDSKSLDDTITKSRLADRAKIHDGALRTISTRSSAFFGSPDCHLFRTQSPYRRAIQDAIKTSQTTGALGSPTPAPLFSGPVFTLPARCPSTQSSDRDPRLDYAESLYSPSPVAATIVPTDGCATNANVGREAKRNGRNAVTSAPVADSTKLRVNKGAHDATTMFLTSPAVFPSSLTGRRMASDASSVEWKAWLSANVEKLETSRANDSENTLSRIPARRGHMRENALLEEIEPFASKKELQSHSKPKYSVSKGPSPSPSPQAGPKFRASPRIPVMSPLLAHGDLPSQPSPAASTKQPASSPASCKPSSPAAPPLPPTRLSRSTGSPICRPCRTNESSPAIALHPPRWMGSQSATTTPLQPTHQPWRGRAVRPPSASPTSSPGLTPAEKQGALVAGSGALSPGSLDGADNINSPAGRLMVDVFLNSRRRMMAGSDDGSAFV